MTEGFFNAICSHLLMCAYYSTYSNKIWCITTISLNQSTWKALVRIFFFSTFSTTAKDRQNVVYLPDVAISRFIFLNGALSKCFAVVISFIFEYLGRSENKRNYLKLFPVFTLIIVYSNNSICLRHITLTNTTQKGSAKGAKKFVPVIENVAFAPCKAISFSQILYAELALKSIEILHEQTPACKRRNRRSNWILRR